MICKSCRSTLLSRLNQQPVVTRTASSCARQLPIARPQFRSYSSDNNASVSAPPSPSAPRQPTVDDLTTPSAISSATPGVSQPLSTPAGVHVDGTPGPPKNPPPGGPPTGRPARKKKAGTNHLKKQAGCLAK